MKSWSEEVFEYLVTAHHEWDLAIANLTVQFETALSEAFSTFVDASELFLAEFIDISTANPDLESDYSDANHDQLDHAPHEFVSGLVALIDELAYPLFQAIDESWLDDEESGNLESWISYETRIAELPHLKACAGCRNYHGQAYGGTLLVCGIHPYGWEQSDRCPDWQGT